MKKRRREMGNGVDSIGIADGWILGGGGGLTSSADRDQSRSEIISPGKSGCQGVE